MANAFGAGGGFCTGSEEIVEHQRLSGQAYTFSASLPAMLTVASLEAINFLESNENNVLKLAKNSEIMWKILDKNSSIFELTGEAGSPIFHIRIKDPLANRVDEEIVLQEVVEMVFELFMQVAREGILLTRAKYVVAQERVCPRASIKVSVSAGFTVREIERTANVICDSVKRVFRKYQV
jgi:serine palmitoyltransferase